jgi:hypothetical protein
MAHVHVWHDDRGDPVRRKGTDEQGLRRHSHSEAADRLRVIGPLSHYAHA